MGVKYKLTEEIVHFILTQKRELPQLSCRELAHQIQTQFERQVSKSSINEVLIEAKIGSPRGRKQKEKFQIPYEKKAQLFVQPRVKPLEEASPSPVFVKHEKIELPTAVKTVNHEPLMALTDAGIQQGAGEYILKAVHYDFFPKPWRGMSSLEDFKSFDFNSLKEELLYRSLVIYGYRFLLEDGSSFCVDSRLQGLQAKEGKNWPAPLERALTAAANLFVNNLQPIVIKEVAGESLEAFFFDFFLSCQGRPGKGIVKIDLLDKEGEAFVSFPLEGAPKKQFIVGIGTQVVDIKEFMNISNKEMLIVDAYGQEAPLRFFAKEILLANMKCRAVILCAENNEPYKVLISNFSESISDGEIVREFFKQHPFNGPLSMAESPEGPVNNYIDFLKLQAQSCFPRLLSDDQWSQLMLFKGQIAFNSHIRIVTLLIPNVYETADNLKSGCAAISTLGVKNEADQILSINVKCVSEEN